MPSSARPFQFAQTALLQCPCPNGWVTFIRVHLGQRADKPAQGRSQNTQHQTRQKRRTTLALSGYFGVTLSLRSAGTETPTPTITTSRFTRIRKSAGGHLTRRRWTSSWHSFATLASAIGLAPTIRQRSTANNDGSSMGTARTRGLAHIPKTSRSY